MKTLGWINNSMKLANLSRWSLSVFSTIALIWLFVSPARAQLAWNTNTVFSSLPITALSVQEEFNFTNIGVSTIHLSNIYSTCGCTTVLEWPSRTIPPGTKGKIIVKIDVAEETGILTKKLYIYTDNSAGATYTLNSIIKIPDIVVFSPQILNFERTNPVEQTVIFSNILESPITISVICDNDGDKKLVESTIDEIEPGREYALHIKPYASENSYIIRLDVIVQQQKTGVTKHYRFQANVN